MLSAPHNLGQDASVTTAAGAARAESMFDVSALLSNLRARGFAAEFAETGAAACERLIQLVPHGADVSNGSSVTINEIGFLALLEAGANGWRYRRSAIKAEADEANRLLMRRSATTVDYIVGSVNAVALTGELVLADFGGTRVGAYAYGAGRVILIVGVNKIAPDLDAAIRRVRDLVLPLEDRRTQAEWGAGSKIGKLLTLEHEVQQGRIRVIIVNEALGF